MDIAFSDARAIGGRCCEAIWRIVDRSMQVLGRLGITEVRPFRIYDGPSEVHRWSIAQRVLRGGVTGVRNLR